MSETVDEALTDEGVEPAQDPCAKHSLREEVPGISPAIVGNTTDIVSRDWTGDGDEGHEDEAAGAREMIESVEDADD
jgi:hypothetical protein